MIAKVNKEKFMSETAKLTIYFIPSPKRLNWTTPTTLARTILTNKLSRKRRFMGHVNVELEFSENGEKKHFLTGMVAAKLNAVPLLLKEKAGLGILFHSFKGRLENKEELLPELTQYMKEGNESINFIEFDINLEAAKRVETYLKLFKAKKLDNYYGLFNSPLHAEGAGCSAFGASVLDVAGLLSDDHRNSWTRCFKVPHKLAGRPLNESKTSFFNLLFRSHKWSDGKDPFTEIFFWDPDLMHAWVEKNIQRESSEVISKNNSKGLHFNCTKFAVPTGPIFKHIEDDNVVVSLAPDIKLRTNVDKYLT